MAKDNHEQGRGWTTLGLIDDLSICSVIQDKFGAKKKHREKGKSLTLLKWLE